ncbi:MAG: MBL fold metallo-hydrolase [Candidatus Roizmanbacteria bacterium]|nr:MBL fold metallo-hydrolase [Candidatus Roizmanbacteria bacterium]
MKHTLYILIGSGLLSLFLFVSTLSRYTPRVVFCDVGQGDAIYFRLPNGSDVLVDTGKGSYVTNCLNRNMPLFDRTIEAIFITHAQSDHASGLLNLIQSYTIKSIYTSSAGLLPLSTTAYPQFWHDIRASLVKKHILLQPLFKGDRAHFGSSLFTVVWPEKNMYTNTNLNLSDSNNTALGIYTTMYGDHGTKTVLLLSDMDSAVAEKALQGYVLKNTIWKVNHHGSRYGISKKLVRMSQPAVAVISSGKGNIYGHPHKETIDLLEALHIPKRRTDTEGDVVITL